MAGADDYNKFKAGQEQARAAAAASVVRSLRDTNPDQKARATTVAGIMGVPDQIYETNPAHFDALLDEQFNKELLRRSPRLASTIMTDPRIAALAHDDLQNLSAFEQATGPVGRAIGRGARSLDAAPDTFGGILDFKTAMDIGKTRDQIYEEMVRKTGGPDGPDTAVGLGSVDLMKAATDRFDYVSMFDETDREAMLMGAAKQFAIARDKLDVIASSPKSETAQPAVDGFAKATTAAETLAVLTEHPIASMAFLAETAAEFLPVMGVAGATSMVAGPEAGVAVLAAGSFAVSSQDELMGFLDERRIDLSSPEAARAALRDPELMNEAIRRGLQYGLLVAVFDAASGGVAGRSFGIANKAGRAAVDLTVQAGLGAGGEAAGQMVSRGEITWRDVILEGLAETITAPIEAGAMGRAWLKDNKASKSAQSRRDMFTAISDSAKASKLRGRMPAAYGKFVDAVTKNGPVATLYVPAKDFVSYFQSQGVDPATVASSLGLDPDAVATAAETGGDLSIPTAVYAEKIAGSKHDAFIMDNMRTSPDEMTFAESKVYAEQKSALMAEAMDEAEKAKAQAQIDQTATEAMFTRVKSALVSAGRTTSEAETNAAVYPAFFTTLSERAGMTPDQLMDRIGLPRIQGELSPVAEDLATTPDLPATLGELRAAVAPAPVEGADPTAAPAVAPVAPADERLAAIKDYLDQIGADLSMADDEIAALIEGDTGNVESKGKRYAQEALDAASDAEAQPLEDGADVSEDVDATATLDAANALSQGQSWNTGRDLKLALQARLKTAQDSAGVDVSKPTAASLRYLTRVGVKDALMALQQNPNAIGWYDEKTRQALAVVATIHPEIAKDENARFAFTWALAVTSNGLKVGKNFELADMVYRRYKADGRMPSDLTAGQAQKAINESLELFNELSAKWGMENLRKFMQTRFTVGEISSIAKDLKPSGEFAATEVMGSAILGPKIGNGFFSNLYGNFDALTMDRWLIRTWGRWTGTLITINEPQVVASRKRVSAALAGIDLADLTAKLTAVTQKATDRNRLLDVIEVALADTSEDQSPALDAVAAAVAKASMEPKLREAMNEATGGEALRKAGNALAKYNDGQKEAPAGPAERDFIRKVFGQMLAELQTQPEYADLTMADLQAVLWYAEKRLYETAKDDTAVAGDDVEGYEDDDAPDYANAAAGVARADGVPEAKIKAALKRESKDGRAAAARRRDGEAQEGGPQQQAAAGGFARSEKREFVQTRAIHRVRSARGGDAAAWSYGAGSTGSGGKARVLKSLGVTYTSEWKAGRSLGTAFRSNSIATPEFYELEGGNQKNAAAFVGAINAGRDTLGENGKAVYVYPAEDYTGMRLFLTKDGKAGFAVKPDGDIVSVFSSAGTGAGRAIMETAIAAGGRKLDAFHTILPSFYAAHGFRGVARLAWADDQAPDGWDKAAMAKFNGGEPDVVFMVYDPDHFAGYDPKATPLKKGDGAYDAALKAQAKGVKSVRGAGLTLNQGANDEGRPQQDGDGSGRYAAGGLAPLAGAPTVTGASGPDPRLVAVAEGYARDNGITLARQAEFVEVDPERGARIAAAYEAMPHAPQDPAVKEAYQNLIAQTLAQYRALEAAGYEFFFFDETNDPYEGNPWNAMRDLRANQRMGVFATEAGFGSGATELNVDDNPLLADTGIEWSYGPDGQKKRVLANDLFRAVHDAFGHGLEGAGFRARGEENAWQAHVRLFTGSAVAAITSETRGQNSWLNFGPNGESNQTAKVEDTVFADQKTGLMPSWTWEEGRAGDMPAEGLTLNQPFLFSGGTDVTQTPAFKAWFGGSKVVGPDGKPLAVYHGTGAEFEAFSVTRKAGVQSEETDQPIFFAADRKVAEDVASSKGKNGRVIEAYIKIENPFDPRDLLRDDARSTDWYRDQATDLGKEVYDAIDNNEIWPDVEDPDSLFAAVAGGEWDVIESAEFQSWIKGRGHDGFAVIEGGSWNYGVYSPTQIKSVNNVGTFDPADPRILNQNMAGTNRGAITLPVGGLGKGETIIRLFASADLSTFMHESGHFFLSAIQALAADPQATPEIQAMYQTVKDWWLDNAADVARDGTKVTGTKVTADDVLNALANGTSGNRMVDLAIDIGMQEQWARAFEVYLLEGKSPSAELRGVFSRMAAWLKLVYQTALRLNVNVSDDLRSVFDRMLATDEQMKAAQEDMSDAPLFESAEQAGMTPEEFKVLQGLWQDARDQMQADLLEKTMEPIRRQRMKSWKEERVKVEAEVRKDVSGRQVYAAISALRFARSPAGDAIDPPVKISRDAIKAAYPSVDVGKLAGATKDGKGHRTAVFSTDEGGLHPDLVASMFGYETGGDLLLDLSTAPDMESVITKETDAIMAERYPDPMTDGTVADEAIKAMHSDKRAQALERELAALTKMAGEDKPLSAKAARAIAEATLKAMPVKSASKPQAYLAAERRAAREAIRLARQVGKQGVRAGDARQAVRSDARGAVKAGAVADPMGMADTFDASNAAVEGTGKRKGFNDNLEALISAKRQRLLNHMLYAEARKIEAKVDSVTAKLSKLNRPDKKLTKARDINHIKAARAIAAKFGLARGDTSFDFEMWIEQLAVDDPLAVSAMTAAIQTYGQNAKPFGDLTVAEFGAVVDAIDSVLEVGKALKKAEIDGKAQDRDQIIGELTAIAAGREKGRELGETRRLTQGEKRGMRLISFRASLVRAEAWARDMDDGGQGPFNRYIIKPVQDALGRYRDDRIVRLQELLDILNPRRKELLGAAINAPELGYSFENKGELLHAILHTGNDSNMQKLLIGRGWSTGFVNRKQKITQGGKPSVNRQGVPIMDRGILDTSKWDAFMERMYREGVITKEDIDTATKIWRLMDATKRPAQTAHKRIYGYYFGEIEPRMVDTPWGPVQGGYVPAIGDRLASTDAGKRQGEAALEANTATSMFPTTGSGFTKGRVEQYSTPLELNLMLLPSHLDKVLRFTHLEPIIRQTGAIVNDRGFRAAMQNVDPKIIDIMVIPWLQRAASQTVETKAANDGDWQHWRLWSTLRRRAGISTMFANVVNTAQQITGLSTAALLVKPARLASATTSFLGNPLDTRERVMDASAYMRNRMGNQSQDLARRIEDAVVQPTTPAEIEAFVSKHGYFLQTAFQNVIDPIVWTAAYDQGVAGGMTHEAAVFEADSVVRRTQSDIQPENVSAFEMGSPFARLFSMFYSYFNAQANLVGGEMATAIRTLGWNGKSKYAFIYAFGIAIPAIAAEAIVQAAKGELGDEDDDGWTDDLLGLFLGSQARYVTAFLPFVGNITNAVVGRFTSAFYDDRLSTSAAVSFIERAASAPYSVVQAVKDPEKTGRAVGDTATLLALLLGIPAGQFAKTTGFLFDTANDKQNPETPLDVARGLVTGRSGT